MSAPDPYAGGPGEFRFFDYKEAVGNRHPGGAATFTRSRAEASLPWYVDAIREAAAIRAALGWDAVTTTPPYQLLRTNPLQHPRPGYGNLYCTGVAPEPFAPDATNLKGRNLSIVQAENYFTSYRGSKLTLHFEPLPYPIVEDGNLPNYYSEYLRNCTFNLEPRFETLSLDNMMAFAEGSGNTGTNSNPIGQPFTAPWAQILVKPDIAIDWFNVPSIYVETPVYSPTWILAGLGKVNSRDWYVSGLYKYPAGTLLCLGAKIVREPNPLYFDTSALNLGSLESPYNLRITLLFSYFNPSKGFNNNGSPITTDLGWNNGFWQGARNAATGLIISGDINAGKWFLFTHGGGAGDNRLLESYNFDNFFNCAFNPPLPL